MFIKGGDTARAAGKATTSSRSRSLKKCGRLPMVGALAVLVAAVMLLTGIGGFGADAQAAVTVESSESTDSTAEGPSFTSPTTGTMWRTGTGDNRMMLVGISWCNGIGTSERWITSVKWTSAGSATPLTEVRTQAVSQDKTTFGNTRYAGTAIYAWPTGNSVPSNQKGYLTVTFNNGFGDNDRYVTLGMVNFKGVDQTNPLGAAQSSSNNSLASNPTMSTSVTGFAGGMVFDSAVITQAYGYAPSLSADSDQLAQWSLCRTGTQVGVRGVGTGGAASTKSTSSAGSTTMSWSADGSHYRMWAQAAVPLRPATHTINASVPGTGGTISPTTKTVNHGDPSGDFTISPTDGYELDKLTDNDTDVTANVSAAGTYSIASVTEDHTLVATFKKARYTITFDSAGGSEVDPITQDFGTQVTAPDAPTKEGYTFTGWEPELPATMPAENRTVTAQWKVNTYTVTFDANGGSAPAPSTMTVAFDAPYGTLATTSRAGYTFVGWFTARTGGTEVTAATLVGRAEDHTLYAQWSVDQYTITFNTDGGSEVGPIIQDFGTPVTPPENPTKEGHTFTGWQPQLPETMPAENRTVTAQWSIDQYTITATADPTAGGTVIGTGTYDHGEEVTLTAIPATGYHFTGWTEDGETIDGADTTHTFTAQADRTLVAEFALNEYTITVDAMPLAGGTVSDGGVYLHGAEVTVEAVPAPGYRFDRWDDAATATTYSHLPTYTFSADGDISLVARFAKEDTTYFTLTYTAGPGGTILGEATQRVEAGSDGTTVTAVPDPGYRFVRWSDGFSSATRTDTDVRGDISMTAEFAPVAPTKDRWSDISDSAWQRVYGISVDQAYAVAQGYGDGTFRPADPLTRAHCAKMIVDGFAVERLLPDAPTFSDVRTSHPQYGWIEGGYAAKVVNGYADGTFRPANNILRQQFNSMLARVFVQQEIDARGGIQGADGTIYETLGAWYEAEGAELLARFADGGSIYRDHRANTAYLILRGVVKGGEQDGVRFLDPLKNLTRAQAVAMITRAGLVVEDF